MGDESAEMLGIKETIGLGEGGAANRLHAQKAVDARNLAGILDGAQRAEGGIIEGQEIGNHDIVVEENAVGMGIKLAQLREIANHGTKLPAANERFKLRLGLGTLVVPRRSNVIARCGKPLLIG